MLSATRPPVQACTTADYTAGTGLGQPFLGRLIEGVGIQLRKGRPPCLLRRARIHFAIQAKLNGRWRQLDKIQGNPAQRTVGTLLTQTYGAFSVFWAWSNWCGSGPYRDVAFVNGRTVDGPTHGATCEGRGGPSTLTPSYGHS